ncbi:MAG: hypothetical protein HOV80_17685 [Polyangiaceae bacterium]|nr:hypothetical protein [Polyangiaceae bacterium]
MGAHSVGYGLTRARARRLSTFELPRCLHSWRADQMVTSGTQVLELRDRKGTCHLLPPASPRPTITTINTRPGFNIQGGAYLKGDVAAGEDLSSGSMFVVGRFLNTTAVYEVLVACGLASLVDSEITLVTFGTLTSLFHRRENSTGIGDTNGGGVRNEVHGVLATWNTARARIIVDAVETGSSAVASTADPIRRYVIGVAANLSTLPVVNASFAELQFAKGEMSQPEIEATFGYYQAWYGGL